MKRIMGFDLGVTSVGWCRIAYDRAAREGTIEAGGVRIFPEPRDNKSQQPLNVARRDARRIRRQYRHAKLRRRRLNELLSARGFLPSYGSADWDGLMKGNSANPNTGDACPWKLRATARHTTLTKWQIGRVLYHIAKHRHYSRPHASEDRDSEDKSTMKARSELNSQLEATGQTLGEWQHKEQKLKKQYAFRRNVKSEFDAIWDRQAMSHIEMADNDFRKAVHNEIFFQRPVFWREGSLRRCRLFPDQKLAKAGSWLASELRVFNTLNNLRIIEPDETEVPLNDEARTRVASKLQRQKTVSWSVALREARAAGQHASRDAKLNIADAGGQKLQGNEVEFELNKLSAWKDHPQQQAIREELEEVLALRRRKVGNGPKARYEVRSDGSDFVKKEAIRRYGFSEQDASIYAEIRLGSRPAAYSAKAIRTLLPEVTAGVHQAALLTSEEHQAWRDRVFPKAESGKEVVARLIANLTNPTVRRTIGEALKVARDSIAIHGPPDIIRVESTRELKQNLVQRQRINREINKRRREREEAANIVGRKRIDEYLLHQEQDMQCVYCGKMISMESLQRGHCQIDHILPRSRSLDNRFTNKTLCCVKCNQEKGARTPHEWLTGKRWSDFETRVRRLWPLRKGRGPRGRSVWRAAPKRNNFLANEIDESGAQERMLRDTSYIAREFANILKAAFPGVRVDLVSGRGTAQLRRTWELDGLLGKGGKKNRADHRHHAVDALVVACSDTRAIQTLARYWKSREWPDAEQRHLVRLGAPWPSIRSDADGLLQGMIVSHRVNHRLSGALHEETVYGRTGDIWIDRRKREFQLIVVRKPLDSLKDRELWRDPEQDGEGIRDPAVRQAVRNHVTKNGGNLKKAIADGNWPLVGKQPVKRVRYLKKELRPVAASTGVAIPGANDHMAIYRRANGRWAQHVESLFDASARVAQGGPRVDEQAVDGEIVMSLHRGDTVRLSDSDGRTDYWVVVKMSYDGRIGLRRVNQAADGGQPRVITHVGFMKRQPKKVLVDRLGRVGRSKIRRSQVDSRELAH